MKNYLCVFICILLSCGPVICYDGVTTDTIKRAFTITYQPILNVSSEVLLIQYLSLNTEISTSVSNVSYDLQNTVTYSKTKVDLDQYRSIEHNTYVESEVGMRFYFMSYKQKIGRTKKLKVSEKKSSNASNTEFPTGFYLRPAVGGGFLHYYKDEISLSENIHRTTEKFSFIPTIGAYIGCKLKDDNNFLVVNTYLGVKIAADLDQKIVYISPLVSVGIGVQF